MSINRTLFDEKFAQLRRRFSARLEEYALQLEQLLGSADSTLEAEANAAIADLMHRISGTAGSFGFATVSANAAQLDAALVAGEDASTHRGALSALVTLLRTEAAAAAAATTAPSA